MDLDSSRDADESEYLVAVDGVAAARQREVKSLQILVDHQYVVLVIILAFHRLLQVVGLGASVSDFVPLLAFPFLEFQVLVDDGIDIHGLVGNALIEVGDILVAQLADESHQDGFIVFQLAVLELAFQGFLGKLGLLGAISFRVWRILVRALEVVTKFSQSLFGVCVLEVMIST